MASASPFDFEDIPAFELPEADADAEAPWSSSTGAPAAPRLRPLPPPSEAEHMDLFMLPPAFDTVRDRTEHWLATKACADYDSSTDLNDDDSIRFELDGFNSIGGSTDFGSPAPRRDVNLIFGLNEHRFVEEPGGMGATGVLQGEQPSTRKLYFGLLRYSAWPYGRPSFGSECSTRAPSPPSARLQVLPSKGPSVALSQGK